MNKKIVAILMVTLMSATMFAGMATVSATRVIIPDDAPKEIEVPDKLPIESILYIDDAGEQSRSGHWDLYLDSMSHEYKSGHEYEISYTFWQYGQDDLYGYSDWCDESWIRLNGNWVLFHTIDHDKYDRFESHEDYDVSYNDNVDQGYHWFHHYLDADNDIPESGTNPEDNNDLLRLWYFAY